MNDSFLPESVNALDLVTLWMSLWLTEVIIVKIRYNEPVPFWMYGLQTLCMAVFFKW